MMTDPMLGVEVLRSGTSCTVGVHIDRGSEGVGVTAWVDEIS